MPLYTNENLYLALKELKVIDDNRLHQAYDLSQKEKRSLEDVLVERDLITDENLGRVISDLISIPLIRLSTVDIPKDILRIIPEVVAQKHKVIAYKKDEKGLHVAMWDPSDKQIKEFIEKKIGSPILVYYATKRDLENALFLYSKDVEHAFGDIIEENVKEAKGKTDTDPPIIKIVDTILIYAHRNKASDVHIEPLDDGSLIRFRIDGVLHDIRKLPLELHPQIVTRIKVLAKLRTDEHQAAQDGKIQFEDQNEKLDIRVSVVPITEGEKVVMRLLSETSRQFSLASLGLSESDLKKIENAYQKPYGMLLATGPTGSGKTTTLYSILKLLNKRAINIMTIEDPVEYDIEGVNQIQVNPKTNLTFSAGLRSIVRQDPDVILVGEIRDAETADISINSAMTGHLVLSTLHTNNAATALPRLIDMETEPFLVASTINVIIAQRLVRKICSKCKTSQTLDIESYKRQLPEALVEKYFEVDQEARAYAGKGCAICHNTGFEGRVGIFEVLEITPKIREAIVAKTASNEIEKIAVSEGMVTMLENGLESVTKGVTTMDELLRVTKE